MFLVLLFQKQNFYHLFLIKCVGLKLILPEKQAGKNSDIINQEKVAVVDKLLENKSMSKKQHKQLLIKCNLLHEQV